jgi:hypothetical protein
MKHVYINLYNYGWGGAHDTLEEAQEACKHSLKNVKYIGVKFSLEHQPEQNPRYKEQGNETGNN